MLDAFHVNVVLEVSIKSPAAVMRPSEYTFSQMLCLEESKELKLPLECMCIIAAAALFSLSTLQPMMR